MAKEKEVVNSVFKVVPKGDGGLYGWKEFDEEGNVLAESEQSWPTEADAEKAIRVIVPSSSKVEVEGIKNINPDSNTNVLLVKEPREKEDENAGMEVVEESVEGDLNSDESADEKERKYHEKIVKEAADKKAKLVAKEKSGSIGVK